MNNFLVFTGFVFGGVLLEIITLKLLVPGKKRTDFSIGRYFYLLLLPFTGVIVLFGRAGLIILQVFLTFSVVGAVFEWLIGLSYHKIVGERLWSYHRYSITKYTSWLSLPLWGLLGVLFWLLAQVLV